MGWQHGYFADEGYAYSFHRHQTPANIAFAALLQGHRPPDLKGPFHYLDLGCGQGIVACVLAAAYPQARFTGVDFHPEHIAHARQLAADCGLSNVSFEEADFLDLARTLPPEWPPVDFAVAHGIASWIAPQVREAMLQVVSRALRPGGLFYVSYNTLPGWLAMVPFQHMVATFQERLQPGKPSLQAAQQLFSRLREAQAALLGMHPSLEARLEELNKQDPAYLVQEYNNGFWQPLFVNQMMAEAAAAKLTFVGSATLVESIEGNYTPAYRQVLAQAGDPALRELCRDLLINQNFRRDVYVKGSNRLWPGEQPSQLESLQVVALSGPEVLDAEDVFTFRCSLGTIQGKPDVYRPLLEAILAGPTTLAQLQQQLGALQPGGAASVLPLPVLLQGLAFLMEKHLVGLAQATLSADGPAQRCNLHLARSVAQGAPYAVMVAPRAGTAIGIGMAEAMVLEGLSLRVPEAELGRHIQQRMARLGKQPLAADGSAITNPTAAAALLQAKTVAPFLQNGWVRLQRLGGWPTNQRKNNSRAKDSS